MPLPRILYAVEPVIAPMVRPWPTYFGTAAAQVREIERQARMGVRCRTHIRLASELDPEIVRRVATRGHVTVTHRGEIVV